MTRTMVANIPGARLREVERELAKARGEEAVNAVIEAHPNESKVLQQLVEWRRAGKNVPPLTRVQRVMLWSDSSIELSAAPLLEAPARGRPGGREDSRGRRGSAGAAGGASRGAMSGARGPQRPGAGPPRPAATSDRPGGPERSGFGPQRSQGGRPQRAAGGPDRRGGADTAGRDGFGGRPGGDRRDSGPRAPRPEGARRYIFAEGQEGPQPQPPPARRGRPGYRRGERDGEERDTRGLPRAGEGWVLLREGEAAPPGPTLGGLDTEPAAHGATTEPIEAPAGALAHPAEPLEMVERPEAAQSLAESGAADR